MVLISNGSPGRGVVVDSNRQFDIFKAFVYTDSRVTFEEEEKTQVELFSFAFVLNYHINYVCIIIYLSLSLFH